MSGPSPEAAGLVEPLRSRWSPSVFDVTHVIDDAGVAMLLEAARWAPSQGNSQPWAFVVAPRGSAAHALLLPHLSRGNAGWVPRASLVLLGLVQVAADPDEPDANGVKDPDLARYDLGQAVGHLTVQAHATGLMVHQFAGYDRPAVAAALGVPDHVQLMAGIAVGVTYATGDPARDTTVDPRDLEREQRPRSRKPVTALAHTERWGSPWVPTASDVTPE